MKKLVIINTSANTSSPGRIAEEIGRTACNSGYEFYFAFGRKQNNSNARLIKIGNDIDFYFHTLNSGLFDKHGFSSVNATKRLVKNLKTIRPDIVNLHNLHGYYINIEILFNYLTYNDIPIVWTLHDCWPFTGHCSYFDRYDCQKWQTQCYHCPNKKGYPKSFLIDNSKNNFIRKKRLFTRHKKIIIVSPSHWLANHLGKSFLKDFEVQVIHNGVDTEVFSPVRNGNIKQYYNLEAYRIILGVANIWDRRKGLDDFISLSKIIDNTFRIVLVGLNNEQISSLPPGITGISRTENLEQMAALYSASDVFVNPTYIDNFPATNIEALSCGTPVITYNTGGCPEAIDEQTGIILDKGDVEGIRKAIDTISINNLSFTEELCRQRAVRYFDKDNMYGKYLKIFENL